MSIPTTLSSSAAISGSAASTPALDWAVAQPAARVPAPPVSVSNPSPARLQSTSRRVTDGATSDEGIGMWSVLSRGTKAVREANVKLYLSLGGLEHRAKGLEHQRALLRREVRAQEEHRKDATSLVPACESPPRFRRRAIDDQLFHEFGPLGRGEPREFRRIGREYRLHGLAVTLSRERV